MADNHGDIISWTSSKKYGEKQTHYPAPKQLLNG